MLHLNHFERLIAIYSCIANIYYQQQLLR